MKIVNLDCIPKYPRDIYKNCGWISIRDWLGITNPSNWDKIFLSFEDARKYIRSLELKNNREWREWLKNKPNNIPSAPEQIYDEWISWGDWLGNNNISDRKKVWLSFNAAKEFIKNINFKGYKEYKTWIKENNIKNIPIDADHYYVNEWISWGDYLGHNIIANSKRKYLEFDKAREIVRNLKIKNQKEYYKWWKINKPHNIPRNPYQTYKNVGWIGIGDWLGTNSVANYNKIFLSYMDAKLIIHKLNLKSATEYREYYNNNNNKIHKNIPSDPYGIYKNNGWISWGDYLGTNRIADQFKEFLSFDVAREYMHTLKLKGESAWREYKKTNVLPEKLPRCPELVYKADWKGWKHFLGN